MAPGATRRGKSTDDGETVMMHTMHIEAKDRPATLERLLRVTRHRGFAVREMQMNASAERDSVTISVTVASDRPISLLQGQLSKLVDVASVNIEAQSQPLSITA
ncbi:acetolactate synthase 2 small subunit [Corallincola holothuriorum]|uniref:Acetolactate synthase 2 small subunit n=3 Tax=Psychromonadaceae TaxID=267894 RepID=A0A368N7M4_9GAMM|nr:acetolactate synthase 2 small subunit [Corallincola holothuriorum]TAA41025.1 acetolactate synthase 2 small subunit [Corallincola spongiicola]